MLVKIEEIMRFKEILRAGKEVAIFGMKEYGVLRRYINGNPEVSCTRITL